MISYKTQAESLIGKKAVKAHYQKDFKKFCDQTNFISASGGKVIGKIDIKVQTYESKDDAFYHLIVKACRRADEIASVRGI
jgi:predicted choloylglycine hydrolase